jgi:hypothetical protein
VTRPQAAALVIGLVAIFAVAFIIGVGGLPPEGRTANARADSSVAWSDLGIGSLVGALVGVVGTHLLHEWREQKRHTNERDALWALVRTEMLFNTAALEMLREYPTALLSQPLEPPLSVQTWEETRVGWPSSCHGNISTSWSTITSTCSNCCKRCPTYEARTRHTGSPLKSCFFMRILAIRSDSWTSSRENASGKKSSAKPPSPRYLSVAHSVCEAGQLGGQQRPAT